MRKGRSFRLLRGVAVSLLPSLPAAGGAAAGPLEVPAPAKSVVVLELFTSQGCSSCAPADRLLSRIGADERLRGRVAPLAFHVDYWNEGGWVDPFSARAWSLRQLAYVRALGRGDPYTPQLVVGGRAEFVGSDERRAREAIKAALEEPPRARVRLEAQRDPEGRALAVVVAAEIAEPVEARKLEVLVALVESGLATSVGGGENAGRTLQDDFIVRRLESAFSLAARPGTRRERTLSLRLDHAWKMERLGVAAFLQDPASLRIHGAAVLPSLH